MHVCVCVRACMRVYKYVIYNSHNIGSHNCGMHSCGCIYVYMSATENGLQVTKRPYFMQTLKFKFFINYYYIEAMHIYIINA